MINGWPAGSAEGYKKTGAEGGKRLCVVNAIVIVAICKKDGSVVAGIKK